MDRQASPRSGRKIVVRGAGNCERITSLTQRRQGAKIVKNNRILIFYHSCGNLEVIIPELIELGITVMNPVQPEAMDPIGIKEKYGDRICLWGGIGSQSVMPGPFLDQVRDEVRRITLEWNEGGGANGTLAQTVLPDVPWENVVALMETVKEYAAYV